MECYPGDIHEAGQLVGMEGGVKSVSQPITYHLQLTGIPVL